jgi:hypothetical protein
MRLITGRVLWRELSPDLLTGHIHSFLMVWDCGVEGLQPVLSRVQISENLLCTWNTKFI